TGLTLVAASQALQLSGAVRAVPGAAEPPPVGADVKAACWRLLDYGKYFMLWGAFTWLQLASDRWAVKLYLNDATVGLFAVAYQIASVPAVIVAGCLSQFITPIVFQRARSGNSREEIAGARRVMLVGAAALLLLTLVSSAAAAVLGDR